MKIIRFNSVLKEKWFLRVFKLTKKVVPEHPFRSLIDCLVFHGFCSVYCHTFAVVAVLIAVNSKMKSSLP